MESAIWSFNSSDFLVGISASNFSALSQLYDNTLSPSTFGIQDALRPTVYAGDNCRVLGSLNGDQDYRCYNPAYLFIDGCDNNGIQNCTLSCFNETAMFGNLTTLHNCVAYPTVAQLYANGNLSVTNDRILADNLSIQKSSQASNLLNNVTSTITQCLHSLCAKSSACLGALRNENQNSIFNSTGGFFTTINSTYDLTGPERFGGEKSTGDNGPFAFTYDVCNLQTAGLDSDVGGIGVRKARALPIYALPAESKSRSTSHIGSSLVSPSSERPP